MTYPVPPKFTPQSKYWADVSRSDAASGWPGTTVDVLRMPDQRSKTGSGYKKIYSYRRNYSMLHTFEPFRQLQDGVWHDYALISESYTKIQVLDLETGEIVAETGGEPHSFCPVDFAVLDWWDQYDDSFLENEFVSGEKDERQAQFYADLQKEYHEFQGNWGLVSGCVWGDDMTWKLRYLDLSRIREGVVTLDDRFGYVDLHETKHQLRDIVRFEPETRQISVPVRVDFSLADGTAARHWVDGINFRD